MATQHPFTLLDIERELTQEQREIQTVTKQYVLDRVKPNIANWY